MDFRFSHFLQSNVKSHFCNIRYFPPVVKIKELIESGALGKVTFSL